MQKCRNTIGLFYLEGLSFPLTPVEAWCLDMREKGLLPGKILGIPEDKAGYCYMAMAVLS